MINKVLAYGVLAVFLWALAAACIHAPAADAQAAIGAEGRGSVAPPDDSRRSLPELVACLAAVIALVLGTVWVGRRWPMPAGTGRDDPPFSYSWEDQHHDLPPQ
jgi:hypothetical protein